jgi:3-phosphoshikimate 1-carboxyvinyltransferase
VEKRRVRLQVPGDKSLTQRALILAALADGESRVSGMLYGGDAESTAGALRALGADIPLLPPDGSEIRIRGVGLRGLRQPAEALDLGNSGTGTRLLMGVLAGSGVRATVDGDGSLRSRPMARVTDPLGQMGAGFAFLAEDGRLPVRIEGAHPLRPIDWPSPVASAQVKSALLLAGLVGGAFVLVSEPRQSRDHTERMLLGQGVSVISHPVEGRWQVELRDPPDALASLDFRVPGDISSAAFFLALGALGAAGQGLTVDRVGLNPTRTAFLDVLSRMGCEVRVTPDDTGPGEPIGSVTVEPAPLRATDVGAEEVPSLIDEIPLIAVLAARAHGSTRISGAGDLRHKESDRIKAVVDNLRRLGVTCEELEDGMVISGTQNPLSGTVRVHGDHRIAMAFGVLGAMAGNQVQVDEPEAADVSFPGFWEMLGRAATGGGGT